MTQKCSACGGTEFTLLGQQGDLIWYECKNCKAEYYHIQHKPPKETDGKRDKKRKDHTLLQ